MINRVEMTDSQKDLIVDLMGANPDLTGSQAYLYAKMILAAEAREDYSEMVALIQEALFGSDSDHQKDSDCTVDPGTGCCIGCGVYHGEFCPVCNGRGFHKHGCPRIVAA